MNQLQIFNNPEFGEIRTVEINKKPYFVGNDIAKDYGMTAQAFNKLLHNLKIQYKRDGVWVLYRNYENQGYTGTKTYNYSDREAIQHAQPHTYWTQKGRVFLYRILKENGYLPVIEQSVAI